MSYLPLRTMVLSDDPSTSYLTRLKDLAFLSFERGAIARIWYIIYTETPPLNLLCYCPLQAHEPMKMQLHPICRQADVFIRGKSFTIIHIPLCCKTSLP
jgi:hypothetical protein